jgi:hypothetical protein
MRCEVVMGKRTSGDQQHDRRKHMRRRDQSPSEYFAGFHQGRFVPFAVVHIRPWIAIVSSSRSIFELTWPGRDVLNDLRDHNRTAWKRDFPPVAAKMVERRGQGSNPGPCWPDRLRRSRKRESVQEKTEVRGETSNRSPHIGLVGGDVQTKMVEVRGETSNRSPHIGLVGGDVQTKMVGATGIEPVTPAV